MKTGSHSMKKSIFYILILLVHIVHTFPIVNNLLTSFNNLRIKQTDKNWERNDILCFNHIEFYGQFNIKYTIFICLLIYNLITEFITK